MSQKINRTNSAVTYVDATATSLSGHKDISRENRPDRNRRVLIYSHDTFGLGHLQRCLKIARSLVSTHADLSILLVTGSPLVHRFELPERVDYIKLPAVRKVGPEQYEARSLNTSYTRILELRTALLLESVKQFEPHLLLVDHSPRGMKGEMLPALKWLSCNHTACSTVLGLRDIIDDPNTVIETWRRDGVYDDLATLYDHIIVYGSQDLYDLTSSYDFSAELKEKTTYCNYICEEYQTRSEGNLAEDIPGDKPLVTVTIGGGDGAGELVIGTYLNMLREFRSQIDFHSALITGPFVEPELFERFRSDCEGLAVTLEKFVPNIRDYFARSALVVATGGYNTVTEIVSTARRAILIPRAMYRQEQLIRAERFAEQGLVNMIAPSSVSPLKLFEEIKKMLIHENEPLSEARAVNRIRLDGTKKVAELFGQLLWKKSPAEVRHNG